MQQNIKDTEESFVVQKTSVLFFQYVDIAISTNYCKPLISKPVFLLPRVANDLQTHIIRCYNSIINEPPRGKTNNLRRLGENKEADQLRGNREADRSAPLFSLHG